MTQTHITIRTFRLISDFFVEISLNMSYNLIIENLYL